MADRSIESGESLAAAADNLGNGDSMNMSNQADEIDVPCLKMSKPHVKEMEEAEKIKQLLNDVGRWVFPGTPGMPQATKMLLFSTFATIFFQKGPESY